MKDLSIKEFANKIRQELMPFYKDERIDINEVVKNNGVVLTGITILSAERNIAPTVYVNEFYKEYQNGRPLSDICNDIKNIQETAYPDSDFNADTFRDFDLAREHICYKLVNAEKNAELLKETPHRPFLDLAIVYYLLVSKDGEGTSSILIKENIAEVWGVNEELLYKLAHRNTPRLFKGCVLPIWDVMAEIMNEDMEWKESETEMSNCNMRVMAESEMPIMPMHVATNSLKYHGAAVILYDNVLKAFSEKVNGDFYILPSSIHETLFIPAKVIGKEENLLDMVREMNDTQVDAEEVLSYSVYRYDAETACVKSIE